MTHLSWQLIRKKPRNICLYLTLGITATISINALAVYSLWATEPDPIAGTFIFYPLGVMLSKHHPILPCCCFSHPELTSLSCLVCEAGQKHPLSVAWPRCKIYKKGIWFLLSPAVPSATVTPAIRACREHTSLQLHPWAFTEREICFSNWLNILRR